jgi:Lrp/AsnC family transcriptional regulator, leucine-responsive regulatory protein
VVEWPIEAMTDQLPQARRQNGAAAFGSDLLDDVNRRLLAELQRDARLRTAELARRVSLSPPAVAERLQRLEQAGVITGYHAAIDPAAIGYPIAAVVRVRPATRQLQKIPEIARASPEVVECHRITGEDCFFLKLHLRAVEDLEEVLDRFTPFGQTTTSIVHSTPVPRRPLPLH